MNKSALIDLLATKENLTVKNAASVIHLLFAGVTDTLKKGGRIEIRGFGSFCVREYSAYRGRNPRTGALTPVGEKRLPFFKVGKELKNRVNGGDGWRKINIPVPETGPFSGRALLEVAAKG